MAHYSAGCRKESDMSCSRNFAEYLYSRADHTEHAAVRVGYRQDMLLDSAESFCRCSVACEYDKMTSSAEQFLDRLTCEFIYNVETARAIGGACVVTEIEIRRDWRSRRTGSRLLCQKIC